MARRGAENKQTGSKHSVKEKHLNLKFEMIKFSKEGKTHSMFYSISNVQMNLHEYSL